MDYLSTEYNQSLILAHDYAVSMANVTGVIGQMEWGYLPYAAHKPDWASWTAQDSLFSISPRNSIDIVTWVGINDLLRDYDTNQQLTSLFEMQDRLYKTGARNFLFFNIPPFHRAPIRSSRNYIAEIRY